MAIADFAVEGVVWLGFDEAVSTYLGHFVASCLGELDAHRLGAARCPDVSDAATEGEISRAMAGSAVSG
jgi:hypothetical protein